ncbi:MAG: hypothetical protein WBM78_01835 [Desulfobacterales bacterium]
MQEVKGLDGLPSFARKTARPARRRAVSVSSCRFDPTLPALGFAKK